jgi:Flp pilus assembly protein TadG
MLYHHRSGSRKPRRGAAVAELAILLPFLAFIFVVAVDFSRIFYYALTLENCARNGAFYAGDYLGVDANGRPIETYAYKSAEEAALADASNFSPAPRVTVGYDSSAEGSFSDTTAATTDNYAKCTVKWTFLSVTNYPGIPTKLTMSRSCVMRRAPILPTFH